MHREAHLCATFSRHLYRYDPLLDSPAVLRWLCADDLSRRQCLGRRKVRAQLGSFLSMLFLNMKHDTTDRFMRDAKCGCYGAERFFLLHHTLQDGRPL